MTPVLLQLNTKISKNFVSRLTQAEINIGKNYKGNIYQ